MPDPLGLPGLLCFWDFQDEPGRGRGSKGPHAYALREQAGPVDRVAVDGSPFGRYAARVRQGQWFAIPRAECRALDLHGPDAQVTVVAWLRRGVSEPRDNCEFVAGVWNETDAKRQYGLFLNLRIWGSADQVCGHVSGTGGPTPGHRWCMDASIGATPVPVGAWSCVGFTYDGREARSYLHGALDARPGRNPYPYPGGLYDGDAHLVSNLIEESR